MKKSITKSVTPHNVGISLVKELKKMNNVEDLGTAMMHSSQQLYLLIQDILRTKYDFTEKELKELNQEVTHAVEGLAYFEEKGLNPMTPTSIAQMVDVTMNHYKTFQAARSGLTLPTSKEATKLLEGKK